MVDFQFGLVYLLFAAWFFSSTGPNRPIILIRAFRFDL